MQIWPLFLFLASFLPKFAEAHVGYIINSETLEAAKGMDISFLADVFADHGNVILIGAVAAIAILLFFAGQRTPVIKKELGEIMGVADSYRDIIPWVLRLSIGLALMGAANSHVIISPLIPDTFGFASWELAIGFFILVGALLTPAFIAAVLLFIFAIFQEPYLLGNLEFLGAATAFLFIGSPRPGFDHLVNIPMFRRENLAKWAPFVLRITLGGSFMYLAIFEKFLNPHISELIVNDYSLTSVIGVSAGMWVVSAGIIEFLIGAMLAIGWQTRTASALAFIILCITFLFFKEQAYPHVTIFGTLSALLVSGGGYLSLDRYLKKRAERKRKEKDGEI